MNSYLSLINYISTILRCIKSGIFPYPSDSPTIASPLAQSISFPERLHNCSPHKEAYPQYWWVEWLPLFHQLLFISCCSVCLRLAHRSGSIVLLDFLYASAQTYTTLFQETMHSSLWGCCDSALSLLGPPGLPGANQPWLSRHVAACSWSLLALLGSLSGKHSRVIQVLLRGELADDPGCT